VQWLSRRPSAETLWSLAGPILRVTAEAGFFTLVYAALSVTLDHEAPVLGPLEFTALVALGALVGTFGERNTLLGAPALLLSVVGAGIVAWLASPEAQAVAGRGIGYALVTHQVGWLGALAVLRGSFIRARGDGTWQFEPLLRTLLPVSGLFWAFAWYFAPPALKPVFVVYAMWGSLALLVSGLAGLGLTRVNAIHARLLDQRVRSLWRWLVVGLAVAVVPLSLPFTVLAGAPVDLIFKPLHGPLSLLADLLLIPLSLIVNFLIAIFTPLSMGVGELLDRLYARSGKGGDRPLIPPNAVSTVAGLLLGTVVVLILAYAAYRLAVWVILRPRDMEKDFVNDDEALEHTFIVPEQDRPRPRGAARRRRGAAHDAAAAYVSAVEALAAHPDWARGESETPAQHSVRMREAEMPGVTDFSRLAADYQLARYAEVPTTPREDRRALARLDRLRGFLRRR
jgi:hypothetical protein